MGVTPPSDLAALVARARAWAAEDPSPTTARELTVLTYEVEDGDLTALDALRDLFRDHLRFGTAGMRGPLGPGPNRMNRAVVRRVAAGVAEWVRSGNGGDPAGGVVVGRDARTGSEAFATETIDVLAGQGLTVHVLPDLVPTPVVAWAVRHLGAAAGIMITASHNPATDNGVKVYDSLGRQVDEAQADAIAAAMAGAGPLGEMVLSGAGSPMIRHLSIDVVDAYIGEVLEATVRAEGERARIEVVHTSLHGVAGAVVRRACREAGFIDLREVAEQSAPDPTFPTVSFPNPEEPGALDRLLTDAAWAGVDVAFASDPDGDRLAMAIHDPERGAIREPSAWRALSGDELGWLLADHLIRRGGLPQGAMMATTIVSSTLLRSLATSAGLGYAETLTGFKWIVRAVAPGQTMVLGYEEALGYCVGDLVADKDGIGAMLLACEMVSELVGAGLTVTDRLDELARRFGVHATGQWSVRLDGAEGAAEIAAAMARLRAAPPSMFGSRRVIGVSDLAHGRPDRGLAPADVVGLALEGGRVVVRPSGTEPKLKCYLEVVEPVGDDSVREARLRAAAALEAVRASVPRVLGLPG